MKKIILPSVVTLALLGSALILDKNKSELSILKEDGKFLFRKGVSLSGEELSGFWEIGSDKTKANGNQIACANCHGADGKGRNEAGRVSADLSSKVLLNDLYDENGVKLRGKYTYRSFVKTLEEGIDPNGNKVSDLMPRFSLSKEQKKAIFGYIKELDSDRDPGVKEEKINLAIVTNKENKHIIKLAEDFFKKNYPNGIFGRQIKAEIVESLSSDDITKNYFAAIVDEMSLNKNTEDFISINDFIIFSLKDRVLDEVSSETPIFSLLPSIMQQGKIAAKYVVSQKKSPKVGFFLEKGVVSQRFHQGFDEAFPGKLINVAEVLNKNENFDYILFYSESNSVDELRKRYKKSKIIVPSVMRVSEKTDSLLYIYPNNLKIEERLFPEELSSAVKKTNYNYSEILKLVKIYTTLEIIASTIKDSGPNPTRPEFIKLIEKIKVENKLLPTIEFNKNKFGISGAYLINIKEKTASEWIQP